MQVGVGGAPAGEQRGLHQPDQAEVDEVLLVLDATTGQNGLTQARVFGDVVKVTGIVLTKLDGTAKGGIVFRVQRELGGADRPSQQRGVHHVRQQARLDHELAAAPGFYG